MVRQYGAVGSRKMKTMKDVFSHKTWFDYARQAWVEDGHYVRCGHPDSMRCGCYGKEHEGEPAPAPGPNAE